MARQAPSRDGEPVVHPSADLRNAVLGRFVEIKRDVVVRNSTVGDFSYMDRGSEALYATIGKFCAIAAHARINAVAHPMERVTQHKISYRPNEYFKGKKLDQGFRARRVAASVTIGHDVWIGHGAIVLPGVTVGTGAVLGAGAVVTKDVAPYRIVVGVPAKPLRRRFPEPIAERLLALAWWDWPVERVEAAVDDMTALSVEAFLEKWEG